MERARTIWDELGLPRLKPEMPWYWETGKWCAERRRSDVAMNTELRTPGDDPDHGERARRKT